MLKNDLRSKNSHFMLRSPPRHIFSSPEGPHNNEQHVFETPRFVLDSILLIENGIFIYKICSYLLRTPPMCLGIIQCLGESYRKK